MLIPNKRLGKVSGKGDPISVRVVAHTIVAPDIIPGLRWKRDYLRKKLKRDSKGSTQGTSPEKLPNCLGGVQLSKDSEKM